MAWVLVSPLYSERMRGRAQSDLGEIFSDVANLPDKFLSGPRGLAVCGAWSGQQIDVVLHRGAAAGGVGDDGVAIPLLEGADVLAREGAGLFTASGMSVERAAASLALGHDDLDAVGLEHADGGAVQRIERHAANASGEQRDAPAALATGGK